MGNKGFILMLLVLVGGWLWVSPDAQRALQNQWQRWTHGVSIPIRVKQMELQPIAGSGAYDSVGRIGQRMKGSHGQQQ